LAEGEGRPNLPLYAFLTPAPGIPRRDLIRFGAMVPLPISERKPLPMTDLMYLAAGFAVLGAFGLYALGLKKV
jgi:hypothetical protein